MRMSRWVPIVFTAAWFCAPGLSAADPAYPDVSWSLVQVTLVPDQLSVVSSQTPIIGVNVEPFWGAQESVDVLNLQPLYGSSGQIQGVSVQGFGRTGRFAGLQLGLANFHTRFEGVAFSLVGGAWESRGLQVGAANFSGNTAPAFCREEGVPPRGGGMQLGVFNSATSGFQLGLVNYNENSTFPWMILFNASAR